MTRFSAPLFAIIVVLLTYVYLYPGSQALLKGNTTSVMSDDTDPASVPYGYDMILQEWHAHPSRFFYGSIYMDRLDPEHGTAGWYPWNERWLVLLLSHFFPLEQLSTGLVFCLLLLNALCMYLLCNYLKWPKAVGSGLAIAWAFNCFTRARAKVHMAMTGIYHLPLIFLALFLVVRGRSKRSLALAMLAFLLAGTVVHYFLITSVFLSPVFLLFLAFQPEFRADWRRVSRRMVLAVTPLILFLGWNYWAAVPSGAKVTADESRLAGFSHEQERRTNLLFLNTYYARPLDYLGGDISLQGLGFDLNPLRAMVNEEILSDLGQGNAHERTNGIRWTVLALGLFAFAALVRGKYGAQASVRDNLIFFFCFGALNLWLSLSPNFPVVDGGASYLMFWVFPKIRVAARAGVNVHFALLMICGFFLSTTVRWRKIWLFPGLFALLMVADYPPVQPMPMAAVRPVYQALQRERGPCGMGMAFPYFSPYLAMNVMYGFAQRMRGSDCPILNSMSNLNRTQWMTKRFPPSDEFLRQLPNQPQTADLLEKLVRCVPLNWIAFHAATPRSWVEAMCRRLGWTLNDDLSCVSPHKDQPLQKYPEQCGD